MRASALLFRDQAEARRRELRAIFEEYSLLGDLGFPATTETIPPRRATFQHQRNYLRERSG